VGNCYFGGNYCLEKCYFFGVLGSQNCRCCLVVGLLGWCRYPSLKEEEIRAVCGFVGGFERWEEK